jgi:hypothetical protein
MMKKALIAFFVIISGFSYTQTLKVDIDAKCVAFNELYNKAFVAVRIEDENYPKNLLQLDPYTGFVEKSLPLNDNPIKILFTPDNKHLYVSYKTISQIDKINLAEFQITGTVNVGELNVVDFAISPTDENTLFVVLGDGNYPERTVMYVNGILQPKQIADDLHMDASFLSVKSDGKWLYGHNGENTGFQGYLFEVVDDGIIYKGTEWEYMIASFGEVKNHNDLIYGNSGHVVDPFTDSIPLMEAIMPVYKIADSWSGFDYSTIHGCYVFGHETDYNVYISFFHGQFYNYLGSLLVESFMDVSISDIDIVDENHFILVFCDPYNDDKYSLLFYTAEGKKEPGLDNTNGTVNEDWFKNYNLIKLPIINDSVHKAYNN